LRSPVAVSLQSLAVLYYHEGRYADAEPLYKRALAIREKAFGPDDPQIATSLNSLPALDSQGRYADAEPLLRRALAIREQALGRDHPDVATSLNNLAFLCRTQARYADAEPFYKQALTIWEKMLGRNHPSWRHRATTWLSSTLAKVVPPMLSRSISNRWRSSRKRSVPIIPVSRTRCALRPPATGWRAWCAMTRTSPPRASTRRSSRRSPRSRRSAMAPPNSGSDPAERAKALAERRASGARVAVTRGYGDF
jgi:tetratricopeptide (TPR) repeat protein